jgi:hypothetical protein
LRGAGALNRWNELGLRGLGLVPGLAPTDGVTDQEVQPIIVEREIALTTPELS